MVITFTCRKHQNAPDWIGSSPRLRGTPEHHDAEVSETRFIPAPAGNTLPDSFRLQLTPLHPRACGEHLAVAPEAIPSSGSSPRLRGTLGVAPCEDFGVRFIPAPAGNTSDPWPVPRPPPVHPRACGEQSDRFHVAVGPCGSSPRLRGTQHGLRLFLERNRFIPAPAGNTGQSLPACRCGPVHPRACGEHLCRKHGLSSSAGSSPRLRGTRQADHQLRLHLRFIPAPAGNTGPLR